MDLWKLSFELVSKELNLTKKKKQALNGLLSTGKISQSTYESLEKEIDEAVLDLEAHRKSLVDKMTARTGELERQKASLELFITNLEIHHIAGEVDEETYNRQNEAIKLGLEATKREMEDLRSSLTEVTPTTPTTPEVTPEAPTKLEAPPAVSERVSEPSATVEPVQEVPKEDVTAEKTEPAEPAKPIETSPPSTVIPQGEPMSEGGQGNP